MGKSLTMASSGYQMSDTSLCDVVSTSGLPLRKIARRKIHLVLPSSPWLADSKTNVPLGVLYIAGLLREHGHDVVVTSMLDKRYEGNIHLPDAVMDADVHMFGFCTPQFGEALELAAYIKDRAPEALLVAGGPHPSYEPRETKEAGRQDAYHYKGPLRERRDYRAADGRQLFDSVVVMEGEVATLQLLSDWDAGQLQPYYYGDKADAMNLDAIPFPAWDLLPEDHIFNDGVAVMKKRYFPNSDYPDASGAVMSLIGTRGCPYKCTYCFVEGTLIDTPFGSEEIQTLSVGDLVLAFDQKTGNVRPRAIIRSGSRIADDVYELKLADGTVLGVTGDHPFVTPEGWREVSALKPGARVRRLRRSNNGQARSEQDVLDGVPSQDRRASARRDMAHRAHGADGSFESDGRSSDGRQDARDGHRAVRQWTAADQTATSEHAVRAGAFRTAESKEHAAGPSCDCEANARAESNASAGGRCEGSRKDGAASSRGQAAAAAATRLEQTRAAALRVLHAPRLAVAALRRAIVLDRPVPIWCAEESGYAPSIEEARHSLQRPVLAYAGGHRDAADGLRERRLERSALLGRGASVQDDRDVAGERVPGDWIRVESVTFLGRREVFPLSVDVDETFFAHGFATHNCSTPWIGQKPRYRSPANIIAEMKLVMDRGVRMFKFQDDTYTLHRTKLRELAEAIHAELGPGSFAARIHTRVNTLDDHVAESLKLMNCKVTCFGIESGSQRVLDANQKGTKVQQNTDAIINAKKHGFYTIAFLVAGLAGETPETARETMAWLKSVRPYLDSCNLAVGIPYPGSRWWTHPQESGLDILDYNYDNQWIVGFSARDEVLVRPHGATVEEMFQIKRDMFDFLVSEGWAKAEWDEDVRIRKQQEEAAANGVLTAASGLTYAGH